MKCDRWGDGSKFTCRELTQCFRDNSIGNIIAGDLVRRMGPTVCVIYINDHIMQVKFSHLVSYTLQGTTNHQ